MISHCLTETSRDGVDSFTYLGSNVDKSGGRGGECVCVGGGGGG